MAQAFVCDICGYRPRRSDAAVQILNEGVDQYEVKSGDYKGVTAHNLLG